MKSRDRWMWLFALGSVFVTSIVVADDIKKAVRRLSKLDHVGAYNFRVDLGSKVHFLGVDGLSVDTDCIEYDGEEPIKRHRLRFQQGYLGKDDLKRMNDGPYEAKSMKISMLDNETGFRECWWRYAGCGRPSVVLSDIIADEGDDIVYVEEMTVQCKGLEGSGTGEKKEERKTDDEKGEEDSR